MSGVASQAQAEEGSMTHAEQILHAVADLVLAGQSTFARKDVETGLASAKTSG